MEEQKFQALLEEIRLMQAELVQTRIQMIDAFIAEHPELLQVHGLDWYYKNL